jgi:hypothetical protein
MFISLILMSIWTTGKFAGKACASGCAVNHARFSSSFFAIQEKSLLASS